MLEDDDVVLRQQGLFPFHVDEHIRIALAEIVQGDPLQPLDGVQQLFVGPGTLQRRV